MTATRGPSTARRPLWRLRRPEHRPPSPLPDFSATRLLQSVSPRVRLHPGKSGIVELRDGRDAFAARALLADAAERTLDIQYYIWRNDMSGILLFDALRRAADRGVRVRLLLDDNNTAGLDPLLSALNAHPKIEVRLFNPFGLRRWRVLNYFTDFARLNRRMHNKTFTADNQVTIVGGRNIGDEYFDAHQDFAFVDLDVLAIGPVVEDVSKDFERYWHSASSYPAESILPNVDTAAIREISAAAEAVVASPASQTYMRALETSRFVHDLLAGTLGYRWAVTHMVSDDPAKGLGRRGPRGTLLQRLEEVLGTPRHELQLISPYLVPTAEGAKMLASLAQRGVKITILTNSLDATDVTAVHAGYAKRRRRMLQSGITIYELMRTTWHRARGDRRITGSSGSSLHAKTFSVDRTRVFIGSFNLDPRSAALNTEIGFIMECPELAEDIASGLASRFPERCYQVQLRTGGRLAWIEPREDLKIVHHHEPNAPWWRRAFVSLLALLPIEWLL
ncbi:phospholipase D family protein [Steroidobacter sp. S1-65]|uniref:Phospholipase D family protein n=1 Tax=Steroidobacter gossypii TaxID=2805490 RepID=A0ABS1WWT2_9GAMM|nr:phospholipase D family protein [Steroidobacter gossypii]MBM0105440.1 phospholipase D family protein [Steroidobacter gossypii]